MPDSREGLARLVEREGVHPRIVEAFRRLAREDFVPDELRVEAYRDRPVGIPERQTTSQPSLIARMLDAVSPEPDDVALEVGTGYGFQTALLAHLASKVVSIERWPSLAATARSNLSRAGIENFEIVVGDGWQGWGETSPYDVIVVSAAAREIPPPLVEQLAEGGRMVIPLTRLGSDDVFLFKKHEGRLLRVRLVTPARFVPLIPGPPE